jgi:glycerol-3-phosphate acyltransferase PlsX
MPSDKKPVRIAVDAMGGDYAPGETVKGAVLAAQGEELEIILVGPLPILQAELAKYDTSHLTISCINATEFVREGEPPALVLRQKRNASITVATKLVKNGEADAIVSAGPTGAVVASALVTLGTVEGIDRPVIGGPFLGLSPNTIVLDNGGNVDCKPYHLLNFAVVGCVYARELLNIPNPTVALLSVGVEEGKGNELVKESYPLFQRSDLNFIGNVEGNDIATGRANVIVCDGFVGNILVKFCEGLGVAITEWLKTNLKGQLSDADIDRLSDDLLTLTNSADILGGGPLLGVNGVAIVMHGRSRASQFTRAIAQAKAILNSDFVDTLNSELVRIRRQLNDGSN